MPSNGQFWYGPFGFLYKKNTGSGTRRVLPYGLICNRPTNIYNKYVPGAGVGALSTSVRRSKLIHATACNKNQLCGRFYGRLGVNWDVVSNNTN
jgi:hypothetical protein